MEHNKIKVQNALESIMLNISMLTEAYTHTHTYTYIYTYIDTYRASPVVQQYRLHLQYERYRRHW